jgi:hypothetical protein
MAVSDRRVAVAGGAWIVFVLIAAALALYFQGQARPAPAPPPVIVRVLGLDTGWHLAIAQSGRNYQIDKRYDGMSDVEQDDANRYGRRYPDGAP